MLLHVCHCSTQTHNTTPQIRAGVEGYKYRRQSWTFLQHPLLESSCFKMKPLLLYLCLPAIVFQAIFASSSLNGSASLSTNKTAPLKSRKPHSKAKPTVGKLVCKEELPSSRKAQNKRSKSKNVLVKKNELRLLIEFLLKELVEIVIDYFDDDTYPFIVSTHNWSFKEIPRIEVDSARVYMLTRSQGLKALDHALANFKEDERRLIEFGDPKWSNYWQLSSSHDG